MKFDALALLSCPCIFRVLIFTFNCMNLDSGVIWDEWAALSIMGLIVSSLFQNSKNDIILKFPNILLSILSSWWENKVWKHQITSKNFVSLVEQKVLLRATTKLFDVISHKSYIFLVSLLDTKAKTYSTPPVDFRCDFTWMLKIVDFCHSISHNSCHRS